MDNFITHYLEIYWSDLTHLLVGSNIKYMLYPMQNQTNHIMLVLLHYDNWSHETNSVVSSSKNNDVEFCCNMTAVLRSRTTGMNIPDILNLTVTAVTIM